MGVLPFPCQSPINKWHKCLKSSGMVSPTYVRLESPYVSLTVCVLRWILSIMLMLSWRLSGQFCHNNILGQCKIGIKFVGDVVISQIPVCGLSHKPWHYAVVWCIVMGQFFHDLWPISLLLCRCFCKYGLLQSQVGQWRKFPLHPMSMSF